MTHPPLPEPSLWPPEDLEVLNHCPICQSEARTLRYGDLEDWSFRTAPGLWSLWTCGSCTLNYLDPRPTPGSIGRAYAAYYTHPAPEHDTSTTWRSRVRSFCGDLYRRAKEPLRNGYLACEFGHLVRPAWRIGAPLLRAMPLRRLGLDLAVRHLPPPSRPGARLLDIGCGDGSFLIEAQRLGYEVHGVDPDGEAVLNARKCVPNIRQGGFPHIDLPSASFEQITMSHVIEHVHDPVAALEEVRRLLTAGGQVWLSTPNIDAATHLLFGKYWRGLEAPRHLCLFSEETLAQALRRAEYRDVESHPHPPNPVFFAERSHIPPSMSPPGHLQRSILTDSMELEMRALARRQLAGLTPSDIFIMTARC
jgi:2-polyprenyl-3-methyl-5-hydroxy-6-metoxy-1,4-benzoquinol methylase